MEASKFSKVDSNINPRINKFEKHLKQCNILDEEDIICSVMETISVNHNLRDTVSVVASHLNDDKMIPVNSIDMYITIKELGRMIV